MPGTFLYTGHCSLHTKRHVLIFRHGVADGPVPNAQVQQSAVLTSEAASLGEDLPDSGIGVGADLRMLSRTVLRFPRDGWPTWVVRPGLMLSGQLTVTQYHRLFANAQKGQSLQLVYTRTRAPYS